jgi:hypothetical protein
MANDSADFEYSSETVPPNALFVAADEPLLVFPSTPAAERYLEATDVENGVYPAAYGPNGEPYRIDSKDGCVIIEPTGEPNRPAELSLLLSKYLEASGRTPVATATFDDLVAMVWTIESDFWREHDPYGDRFSTRIPTRGCVAFVILLAGALYFTFR